MVLVMFFIPASAMSCIARPAENSLMKVHVVSPKYIRVMESTKLLIKGAFIKVFVASIVLIVLHMLQMRKMTDERVQNFMYFSQEIFSQEESDRVSTI